MEGSLPEGATFDPASGVFNWRPGEDQGPGIYRFSVKVCDNGTPVLCDSEVLSVTLEEANQVPVAGAGEDQIVSINELTILDGTGSYDPDEELPSTYSWIQTGGLSVFLDDPTLETTSFTAPYSPAIITFSLVVTDDKDTSSVEDEVVIQVIGYFLYLQLVIK